VAEHSVIGRAVAIIMAALAVGTQPAAAQQMQQINVPLPTDQPAPPPPPPRTALDEARLSVRQNGGGDQPGLLSKMKGPAALVDVRPAPGESFRSIAGATSGPADAGKSHGYVAGTGQAKLDGFDTTLNYAADELGGSAVEGRFSKAFDAMRLGLSQTMSHNLVSNWTGSGDKRADRITEGSLDWSLFSVPLQLAVLETGYADGQRGTDFRTAQTLQLGSGMFVHSTATGMRGRDACETTGNLIYYGPVGTVQLTAELDYGVGSDFKPTSALIGVDTSITDSWSIYGYAQQPLTTGPARLDVGAVREIGGVMTGPYAGAAADGSAYVGVRLWLPLSASARDHRWLGF